MEGDRGERRPERAALTYEDGGVQTGTVGQSFLPDSPPTAQTSGGDVAADGTVAVIGRDRRDEDGRLQGGPHELQVYNPRHGTSGTVLSGNRPLSQPSFGPEGRLAVFRSPAAPGEVADLAIIERSGETRSLPLPATMTAAVAVEWGATGRIAVAGVVMDPDPVVITVVVDPDDGAERVHRGCGHWPGPRTAAGCWRREGGASSSSRTSARLAGWGQPPRA